jgi:hypothetical protein
VSCSYAFLADIYLPPLELLESMVVRMAAIAPKRVPPPAAAAMLHYCTNLGVLPADAASSLFTYVHKCVADYQALILSGATTCHMLGYACCACHWVVVSAGAM